jgi:tRNA(Ile)-lysidine synthase
VLTTITRYSMFAAGDRVGVAVSGGADSVFLLHALHALAPRWNLHLRVLHLDHGLRGEESAGDAEFVRELAERLGLAADVAQCDVAALKQKDRDNLEQTGRRARRQFYMEFLRDGSLDLVATGHTRSDQAETVLFRFLRGSGTAGLAGVRPVTSDGIVRPLIETEREDIERYLRLAGIAWREDSTTASQDFARNRIRRHLLPQLTREWNPALRKNLARTAEWAQDEEIYWEAEVERLAALRLTVRGPAVLFRTEDMCSAPRAVARRLIRRAIELAKGDLRDIGFQHVEGILQMALAGEGDGRIQVPGLEVCRSFDSIQVIPRGTGPVGFHLPVEPPGDFALPDGSRVKMELIESSGECNCVYNVGVAVLAWERAKGRMELRSWRPGDRYQPLGRAESEKLKDLFQEARVPVWERQNWPILTIGEDIVWVRHFGPALNHAATPASRSVLRVSEGRG